MTIALENLNFHYPGTTIGVHDINLTIGPAELVAVIGPSGSGKTTLLKLVAGFEQPISGHVRIKGEDVSAVPARLRNVGVVFQSYALFPLMSCLENVAYPLKVRKIPRPKREKQAMAMLDHVGLADNAQNRPGTLSGGQQQRVGLARALVFDPTVLLLDEPLSAIDASLRAELREMIRQLQKERGIPALYVTHDQEEALSMADTVAVLAEGRLVQAAPPREIYDAPSNRLVAGFVGHANLWDAVTEDADSVRTDFGLLRCPAHGLPRGQSVVVLVRPERVLPGADENAENVFGGTLLHDVFLGAIRRFTLALPGGELRGETMSRQAVDRVRIPREAVQLLPAA